MTEGHNEQAGIDPFALSDEDYQKEREKLLMADSNVDDTPAGDTMAGDTKSSDDKPEDGDKGQEENPVEVKPFSLEEPEPEKKAETEAAKEEAQTFEIVHRGQVHKVTREKLVELAQKGFDYDFKVGPHGKLVQLIDADRGAQDVLNGYIRDKYGKPEEKAAPKLKPMSEYDDERKWLEDNVKTLVENQPRPAPAKSRPDPVGVMKAAIQSYDPTGSPEIIPMLAQEAMGLSVRDSRIIEESAAKGDLMPFFKFYDHVKGKVSASKPTAKPAQAPSFRMKSGGGEPPRTSEKQINAWEMPQKDFQAMLAKVKGGYS